jgi:hypothetical protein
MFKVHYMSNRATNRFKRHRYMMHLAWRKGQFVAISKDSLWSSIPVVAGDANFYIFMMSVVSGGEWSAIARAVNSSAWSRDSFWIKTHLILWTRLNVLVKRRTPGPLMKRTPVFQSVDFNLQSYLCWHSETKFFQCMTLFSVNVFPSYV